MPAARQDMTQGYAGRFVPFRGKTVPLANGKQYKMAQSCAEALSVPVRYSLPNSVKSYGFESLLTLSLRSWQNFTFSYRSSCKYIVFMIFEKLRFWKIIRSENSPFEKLSFRKSVCSVNCLSKNYIGHLNYYQPTFRLDRSSEFILL